MLSRPDVTIGGDIGGGSVRVGVVSSEGIIDYDIVETPRNPDKFFYVLGSLVAHFTREYPEVTAGAIGFPGPIVDTPEGLAVRGCTNIPGLKGVTFNVSERLAAENPRLRGFPVLPLNDAEAAVHAVPTLIGKPENNDLATYLTLSSGVGGASIHHNAVTGKGMLDEYGHIVLRQSNGSYATLEKLASGRAISRRFSEGRLTAEQIAADPTATKAWNTVGRNVGQAIGTIQALTGATDVMIGGGVSRAHRRFDTTLRRELAKTVEPTPPDLIRAPEIHYVPEDLVALIGIRGSFFALYHRYDELEAA